jgi:hypothetical protein
VLPSLLIENEDLDAPFAHREALLHGRLVAKSPCQLLLQINHGDWIGANVHNVLLGNELDRTLYIAFSTLPGSRHFGFVGGEMS